MNKTRSPSNFRERRLNKMAKKTVTVKQPRSAITGRFVKKWVAEKYPRTTVIQTIKRKV